MDNLTPFGLIPDAKRAGSKTADIMGIMIDADEIKQVKYGQNNVQHFTFVDSDALSRFKELYIFHHRCANRSSHKFEILVRIFFYCRYHSFGSFIFVRI
ncbi:hypothetical protein Leryth_025545 [Lithospermum erythrorhizon]|nr:hypothetical protein Leryth_025545 [Lithospermum erythrorhizon]